MCKYDNIKQIHRLFYSTSIYNSILQYSPIPHSYTLYRLTETFFGAFPLPAAIAGSASLAAPANFAACACASLTKAPPSRSSPLSTLA